MKNLILLLLMIVGSYAHGQIQVEVYRVYDWVDVLQSTPEAPGYPNGMLDYYSPDAMRFSDSLSVDGTHGYYLSLYNPKPRRGEEAYYAARIAAIQDCKDGGRLMTDYNEYGLRDKAGDMDHELRMMIQHGEKMKVIRNQHKLWMNYESKLK